MTVTRSKTGSTPRKLNYPDFVETPGRQRRSRKSQGANGSPSEESANDDTPKVVIESRRNTSKANGTLNGSANGAVNGSANGSAKSKRGKGADKVRDSKADDSSHYEFGGPLGVSVMMIGFPLLMWYMWIGATFYDGHIPLPTNDESLKDFINHLGLLLYQNAFPHRKAWAIYWTFFLFEATCYLLLPGIYSKGKPIPHMHNTALSYYCSGVWSFYLTITAAGFLHVTNIFPLYTLIDEFGPLTTVAIISGYIVSIAAYVSALFRGAQHRMTGNHVYDFFMGAELNPRMLEWLDFKMFFEVRLPWFILFLVTAGACARQYEQFGFVSGELGFLLLAHYLYANACCKGEELITTSWDMYYEKWGFMLIFWNMAGVPLSYCHCTIFLANHAPSVYHWPRWFLVGLYTTYLFVYWVWDTCNSQKNMFRLEERGTAIQRNAFPQLPWKSVKNPNKIPTVTGDSILCDGWYGLARKVHYSCDMFFALSWALVTGFQSPFPWFYPVFFAGMIAHRATRDVQRCRERYGQAWMEYERRVPYLFIPYVF